MQHHKQVLALVQGRKQVLAQKELPHLMQQMHLPMVLQC
jgi:hypothetical protein